MDTKSEAPAAVARLALLPAALVTLICFIGPMALMAIYSFLERSNGRDRWLDVANYEAFWTRPFCLARSSTRSR